jgi:hypothetical protein
MRYGLPEESQVLGYAIQEPSKQQRLSAIKREIIGLFRTGEEIMFQITQRVRDIEREELFKGDLNPDTGESFRSMREYLPYLLKEVREETGMPPMSERQFREYMALDRVFVQGLGIQPSEIIESGVSHFSAIREKLDYDPRTGQIAESPREGKIGADSALLLINEIREAGGAPIASTLDSLNTMVGSTNRHIEADWYALNDAGNNYTLTLILWEDGVPNKLRFSKEQAEWLARRIGVKPPD